MGRYANFPLTVEDLRFLDLKFLSKHDYLSPNSIQSGVITWSNKTGDKNSISVSSIIDNDAGVLTLNYILNNDEKINYQIQLASKTSNLGKGLVWFFICPFTGRYCRKLHLINGYFQHRTANPNLMYEKQIEPKIWRVWNKTFGAEFNDHLYFELHKKYFKKFYNGKITKRYARIRKKLNQRDEVDLKELEKLFSKDYE
ncbi:hypothetical protein JET18_00890 [Chryseobacterium sp. L7]|uniref:Uncharacterized protein n=1 Tax=Chryseobacterium endalhagicum TaxID=2797638 RepID=A0ABS1Q9V1_9FLAO|nr:hypothetical protein [Chryseobacterium endalhagicum]MBL1219378.1 hypothetical protein [Chryseobacterium endalhagicum]